eukprot:6195916-Pleurochrysis_carterae.AAC.2
MHQASQHSRIIVWRSARRNYAYGTELIDKKIVAARSSSKWILPNVSFDSLCSNTIKKCKIACWDRAEFPRRERRACERRPSRHPRASAANATRTALCCSR